MADKGWTEQDQAADLKRRAGLRAEWRRHHPARAEYWRRTANSGPRCVDRATHEGAGVAPCRDPRAAGRCFRASFFSSTPSYARFFENTLMDGPVGPEQPPPPHPRGLVWTGAR